MSVRLTGDGVTRGKIAEEYRGRMVVGFLHDPAKQALQALIDRFEVSSVIEVGSFLGMSACWFAERVDEVVCVDRFDRDIPGYVQEAMGAEGDHYSLFLHATAAYPNISHYRMDSLEAARLGLEADMVYIDAGHSYEDVKADVEAWTPHAHKLICGDDNTPQWPGVQQYVREVGAEGDRTWWLAV